MKEELINIRLGEGGRSLLIIDQSLLPGELRYIELSTADGFFEAVRSLRVRGAPAIGIFAAYSIYVLSLGYSKDSFDAFRADFLRDAEYLRLSRPTAVNLSWALKRQEKVLMSCENLPPENIPAMLLKEAEAIYEEDVSMCRRISELGLTLIKDGDGVLTHCNAGPLATSRYGTALGPIFLAAERGMNIHVYADETRPLMQGARLTAYELMHAGIDVTLQCDNMASALMKSGRVQACFVGCDRIAANGDFANKIGTSGLAVLAKYYDIPFYTLGPTSTVDMSCPDGASIEIEQRPGEEVSCGFWDRQIAPRGVKCFNPAFDVTDHSLLTGIVTEKGICYPPFSDSLKKLFE